MSGARGRVPTLQVLILAYASPKTVPKGCGIRLYSDNRCECPRRRPTLEVVSRLSWYHHIIRTHTRDLNNWTEPIIKSTGQARERLPQAILHGGKCKTQLHPCATRGLPHLPTQRRTHTFRFQDRRTHAEVDGLKPPHRAIIRPINNYRVISELLSTSGEGISICFAPVVMDATRRPVPRSHATPSDLSKTNYAQLTCSAD